MHLDSEIFKVNQIIIFFIFMKQSEHIIKQFAYFKI